MKNKSTRAILRKFAIICVLVFAMYLCTTQSSKAECDVEGQVEVTILRGRSGNIMTICVNQLAVPFIGGPNDYVIPAVCPCDLGLLFPIQQWTSPTCSTEDDWIVDQLILQAHPQIQAAAAAFIIWSYPNADCEAYFIGTAGSCYLYNLTADEAEACAIQIWAFALNELGLDCGEVPDFEP